MAHGPGKYDDVCTLAREEANAEGAILIIINGDKGTGFSSQATLAQTQQLPSILRSMAAEIERNAAN